VRAPLDPASTLGQRCYPQASTAAEPASGKAETAGLSVSLLPPTDQPNM
jgi:hypothetical protein